MAVDSAVPPLPPAALLPPGRAPVHVLVVVGGGGAAALGGLPALAALHCAWPLPLDQPPGQP